MEPSDGHQAQRWQRNRVSLLLHLTRVSCVRWYSAECCFNVQSGNETGFEGKELRVDSSVASHAPNQYIALHANNAEYNPKRFAAVIMRVR